MSLPGQATAVAGARTRAGLPPAPANPDDAAAFRPRAEGGGVTREQYLAALAPLTLRLVIAVREEGPDGVQAALTAIAALPPADDLDPAAAALVTLAAAVDPNATLRQLWGWTDRLTDGTPPAASGGQTMSMAAVLCVAGLLPFDRLDPAEQTGAVQFLRSPARTPTEIATLFDADIDDIRAVVRRGYARDAYRRRRTRTRVRSAA